MERVSGFSILNKTPLAPKPSTVSFTHLDLIDDEVHQLNSEICQLYNVTLNIRRH